MKNLQYLTPRIALLNYQLFNQNNHQIKIYLKETHQQYIHIFNLTKLLIQQIPSSSFKWRGVPYSISQTFKIIAHLDSFLRKNIANTAIFIIEHGNISQYAKFVVLAYFRICQISSNSIIQKWPQKIHHQHPLTLLQLERIYQSNSFELPPIKIIQSIFLQPLNHNKIGSQQPFIPIFKIFSETRYNEFQNVYNHQITDQLTRYYLNKDRCLQTSIGSRYDDCKPSTNFMLKPVIIGGDVKIQLYSFKELKLKQQCIIGFSTICLNEQQQIIFSSQDFYDDKSNGQIKYAIHVKISNYCDNKKCEDRSNCQNCKDMIKKISNRYIDGQQDLQRVKRKRSQKQIRVLLSI